MTLRILEFAGYDGNRIAIPFLEIIGISEEDGGCTIRSKSDTHRVTASYDEAKAAIWPQPAPKPSGRVRVFKSEGTGQDEP